MHPNTITLTVDLVERDCPRRPGPHERRRNAVIDPYIGLIKLLAGTELTLLWGVDRQRRRGYCQQRQQNRPFHHENTPLGFWNCVAASAQAGDRAVRLLRVLLQGVDGAVDGRDAAFAAEAAGSLKVLPRGPWRFLLAPVQ